MMIFLLLVIVVILLFGAAVVRNLLFKLFLAVVAILCLTPVVVKLQENPEWLLVVALLGLLMVGYAAASMVMKEQALENVWKRFEKSINEDFTAEQKAVVRRYKKIGDVDGLQRACKQYQASVRKPVPLSKRDKKWMKQSYLLEQKSKLKS